VLLGQAHSRHPVTARADQLRPETLLLHSIARCFGFLPAEQQQAFVAHALEKAS
jgi:hypothetical protein